ncbi:MAG: acyl-CoA dehydrogenase family protein [Actinomycetota bacterium]
MDFALSPEMTAYRDEIRALVREVVTPDVIDRQHTTGTFNSYELNRALAERGYLERAVPGLGKGDPVELWLLFHELEKAGAPIDGISLALMIAGVVAHSGNDFQKQTVLPALLTGESLVALGYSEPDAGSDVAAAATRAVRDGDEWVIDGTKMWTTMAHEADWIILLTRTNLDVPKHKGLTMFILPSDTPGISYDAVHTMGTERTNATFYDGVRVGDEWRIGDVDGGWAVMGVALAFERGVMGGTSVGIPLLRHFREWAANEVGPDGHRVIDDPVVREHMVRVAIDNEVATLLTLRAAYLAATGALPGLEGSMAKIHATEAYQKAAKWFAHAAAPASLLQFHEPGAAADGWIEYDLRHSPVTTIYGGTSEINRNNVAERHLGLPKAR